MSGLRYSHFNLIDLLGYMGLIAFAAALFSIQDSQFNVVSYRGEAVIAPWWPACLLPGLVVIGLAVAATARGLNGGRALLPMWFGALAMIALRGTAVGGFGFSFVILLSPAWAAWRLGRLGMEPSGTDRPSDPLISPLSKGGSDFSKRGSDSLVEWGSMGSIVLLILILTWFHTRLQINFWEHFSLGHSDIGHYAEELKNCLVGRGLRSDGAENTRLGWHFVPLMYMLVPLYALFPSIVTLMVVGALLVHLPALPIYGFARRTTGSVMTAWMWATAWLLLPTQSRLIYSGTYGFQWLYLALPLLFIMIGAGRAGRWRLSLVMAVLVLLVQETTAPAVFGWGLYVAFFTSRRKTGTALAVGAVVYLLLCIYVFVPHFAASGRYERFSLYGELGRSMGELLSSFVTQPGEVGKRLFRSQASYYLLTLLVPLGLLPLRNWRWLLAAIPTLLPVLLIDNAEFLSIKFWHYVTVLPFFFFAALDEGSEASWPKRTRQRATVVLVSAAMGHWLFGFSPVSQSYRVYANAPAYQRPDPRLEVVRRLRSEIPKDRAILATERMAAHFTEYRRLFTGGRIEAVDYVIIDRTDTWDNTGLPQMIGEFEQDPSFLRFGEFGDIVVFTRAMAVDALDGARE